MCVWLILPPIRLKISEQPRVYSALKIGLEIRQDKVQLSWFLAMHKDKINRRCKVVNITTGENVSQ